MTFSLKKKAPNPNGNPNFKPKWKTGNTIAIRIPEAIADLVISVARKIDNGELSKADISQLCLDNNAIAMQLTALDIGKPSLEIVPPPEPAKPDILKLLQDFEDSQAANWGKAAKQTGEFNTNSPRWTKYNDFKAWAKSLVS